MANLPQSGVALIAQNAGQFVRDMASADGALGSFGKGAGAMSEIVTGALRRVGEFVTEMAADAARAVGTWLKDSVGVAGDFEQTLNVLGATSGATAADLDKVAQKAKELGADMSLPATSAQDAAEVMLELSKAGFSVQESMDAAKGALQLSSAAQVDAATAANITAGAINAFGLEASDAVRVADLLAAGANQSSASMTDLSQGLQQAGFAFHEANMPVEDLVTSLAALTNVGLTGSDAGTALKNALMRLMSPTDKAAKLMARLGFSAYDATGTMKPMPQIINDLNSALAGMTDQARADALETMLLGDGMKAMIPLLDLGADGFLKLKDAVTVQGAAADVANAQMQGWNGGMRAIGSQMETLQLIVGTFLKDALTPLLFRGAEIISNVTAMADRFFKLIPAVQQSAEPFKFLLSVIALLNPSLIGVVMLLTRIYDALLPIITALQSTSSGSEKLQSVLTTILGPLGATESAIASATRAVEQIQAAIRRVVTILSGEVPGATASAQTALASVINFVLGTAIPAIANLATWFADNLPAAISTAKAIFADIGSFISGLMPTIESIVTTTLAIIGTYWQNHGNDILNIATNAWTAIKGLIQIVLGAIQGILAVVLGIMEGNILAHLDTIQAANTTIWSGIRDFLYGLLNAIAAFFGTSLEGIVQLWRDNFTMLGQIVDQLLSLASALITAHVNTIKSTIANVILDAVTIALGLFNKLQSTIDSVMSSIASIVADKVNSIKNAFSGIVSAINSVISAVSDLIESFSNISVPDILTPGSPTPFELGLRGIDKAAKQAASTIQAQLSPALSSPVALPVNSGGNTTTTTNYGATYQMPIYTNQSPAVLSQGLALVEALSR